METTMFMNCYLLQVGSRSEGGMLLVMTKMCFQGLLFEFKTVVTSLDLRVFLCIDLGTKCIYYW